MKLGYNTNGLAHHRLVDAIELLADEGYQSVAITLDAGALDPYDEPQRSSGRSRRCGPPSIGETCRGSIETGARYLLNPRAQARPDTHGP